MDIGVDVHIAGSLVQQSHQMAGSVLVRTLVAGRLRSDEGEQGHLGHETAPVEADDRELAPGNELVGEGARDAEQHSDFSHGVDEAIGVAVP